MDKRKRAGSPSREWSTFVSEMDLLMTTLIDLYRSVHRQLREEIDDLEEEALNWTPGPHTNSIGTLVVHLLSSETEMWHSLLELPTERHRTTEFAARSYTAEELVGYLDAADGALEYLSPRVTTQDLQALRARPNKPSPQPGLFWLVRNYGHAREHLAQLQLTKQVYALSLK